MSPASRASLSAAIRSQVVSLQYLLVGFRIPGRCLWLGNRNRLARDDIRLGLIGWLILLLEALALVVIRMVYY